jgi:hypothetical protein
MNVMCNPTAVLRPIVVSVVEDPPCAYVITMESAHACPCQPNCYGRNCGSDGCRGYCGGLGQGGSCPYDGQSICTDAGVCCKPDCRGRTCGDDGCGGSCGTCRSSEVCARHVCAAKPAADAS